MVLPGLPSTRQAGELKIAVLIGVSGTGAYIFWLHWRRRSRKSQGAALSNSHCTASHADLLDPDLRANHLDWNSRLHHSGKPIVPVEKRDGECSASPVFLVVGYETAAQLSQDPRLSSNPYKDDRLIALNTMAPDRHAVVSRLLHRFYQHREIRKLEGHFQECACKLAPQSLKDGSFEVMDWAKRVHMANSLKVLLGDAAERSMHLVDKLIQYNDEMVRLVAPLGGIGETCPPLLSKNTLRVACGLFHAVVPLIKLVWKAGFAAIQIIRPDKTLARTDLGSGVWHCPELLPQVPRYFSLLVNLLEDTPVRTSPTSPIEALQAAIHRREISLAEALVTIVQLMVNMTSANALGNMVMRLCMEPHPNIEDSALDAFVAEVLRLDAPLQRNPRRATKHIDINGAHIPKDSTVLLFIGAANMDAKRFDAPALFRPGREPGLTFGVGAHYCLGSYLVKIEMREALRFLLKRFKQFQIDSCERIRDVDVGNYGFVSLRVHVEAR